MEDIKKENIINQESPDLGKKTVAVPKPETNIGIDTDNEFFENIIGVGEAQAIDISEINSFSQISNNRETLYHVLDTMAEDPIIASMLEIYTEDATETNDTGRIVWAESSDSNVAKYVDFLLKSLNVDKNIYRWVHSLIKYGDVYLKLFHQSDFEDDLFINNENKTKLNEEFNKIQNETTEALNEDIVIRAYSGDDKLVNYIELMPNPGEMFELTKFGKSFAYIRTNTIPTGINNSQKINSAYYTYKFRRQDVQIFNAVSFVHGALQDDTPRLPEQIQIFRNDVNIDNPDSEAYTYTVRRGQSILFNVYKIWRQMMLLENALLLNRLTKSSILRVVEVEVADMPKERVGPHLQRIKSLVEQKSSIAVGDMMTEYTNPGAMENNVYVPTHNGIGAIQTQQIGGDVNVRDIADIDYFMNKMYGAMKVPKQYLGCLRGNTDILLLNGHHTTVEDMYKDKDLYIGKGIMAINKDGSLQPTVIKDIMLTKLDTGFYRIHLDNGDYVDVTHDHRMMLRDGNYILAEDLQVGDSLMPYYDYVKEGRRYVLDNALGKYRPQYRVVAESVWEIPNGYQVHHKNSIKIDDDFDNLIPLTISEHCSEHLDMLHNANKVKSQARREVGLGTAHAGAKIINNGIRQYWIHDEDELPVGYSYGRLPFTEEHRQNMSKASKGVPKNYDCVKNFGNDFSKKSQETKRIRKESGLYDEQYKNKSEELKQRAIDGTGWFSKEAMQKKYARIPENRRNHSRYVRCLCCGSIHEIKCNDDWYNDYLEEKVFWFCSKDCAKLNGSGKLARSYQLFLAAGEDANKYEYLRWHSSSRPDTYFKYESLEERLPYIDNYTPECNHKVVGIEYIDVHEPAYDISVEADCHTFALPCGIFVHNCTDDATGFNGGTSLSIVSSRYAKTIKRIQATTCQMLTDVLNILLIDRGLDSYVNKFTLRMQPPVTQEELDKRDNTSAKIALSDDVLRMLDGIEDPIIKLKITKALLANAISTTEVIDLIQEYIDSLETHEENTEDDFGDMSESSDFGDLSDFDNDFSGGGGSVNSALDAFDTSAETSNDNAFADFEGADTSTESSLPTPDDLGVGDMSDML